jgi:hypothetical protein
VQAAETEEVGVKRIIALALAATALTTCGISAAEAATTTATPRIYTSVPLTVAKPAPRGPTSAQLAKELLTVKQFPSGWSATNVEVSYAREAFCGISGHLKASTTGTAKAGFNNGMTPIFYEFIMGYKTATSHLFARDVTRLNHCKSFSENGFTFRVSHLRFPRLGTNSAAFQASGSVEGFGVGFDLVVAYRANQVVVGFCGDIGSPSIQLVKSEMRKAVARLPKH